MDRKDLTDCQVSCTNPAMGPCLHPDSTRPIVCANTNGIRSSYETMPTIMGTEAQSRHLWDSYGPPGLWKILMENVI